MTNKKFPVAYHQTLTEVFWPLRLKNLNNDYKCQIEKKAKIVKEMQKNGWC